MRDWYLRIKNSGDVYVTSDDLQEKFKLPLTNICQLSQCGTRYYFIDICGDLWYWEYDSDQRYFKCNTHRIEYLMDDSAYGLKSYCGYRTKSNLYHIRNSIQYKDMVQKINNLARIKTVRPTYIGDFILTFDGRFTCFWYPLNPRSFNLC